MSYLPKARIENIVIQDLEKETLIYDLKTNKAFCLNTTSAQVWQLCDGNNSIAEISRVLSRKLKMQVSEEFVWLALDGLKKDDLLEKADEIEINFNGLTRRQVIKKVGLASMIVLPLISSVVAPQALRAQSIAPVPLGGLCFTSSWPCEEGSCQFVINNPLGPSVPVGNCCRSATTHAPGFRWDLYTGICFESQTACNQIENQCCKRSATFVAPCQCSCD